MADRKNPHVSDETFDEFLKELGELRELEKAALKEIAARPIKARSPRRERSTSDEPSS
jgi:hypothetical protein